MSDKEKMATVVYDNGGPYPRREFWLGPGDHLEIRRDVHNGSAYVEVVPAKVPEPQPVRHYRGKNYRWNLAAHKLEMFDPFVLGSPWVTYGCVLECLAPAFLRFVADLKEETEKWTASK